VCALSWLQSALAAGSAKRLVVLDEAWAVLSHLATARWLQATFKLSRAYGVANVAVVHRLSDLKAAGQDGSQEQRLAEGLLADAETRVVFAQAPGEAERAGELLGLSRTEQLLLSQLPRGMALWRVGQTSYLVEHDLSDEEQAMADTDGAMRAVESTGTLMTGPGQSSVSATGAYGVGDVVASEPGRSEAGAGGSSQRGAHFASRGSRLAPGHKT
jgi:hypothetical protein